MTATVDVHYSFDMTLLVGGVSPSGELYQIEITDAHRAAQWDKLLSYTKFNRTAMGPPRSRLGRAIAWRLPNE